MKQVFFSLLLSACALSTSAQEWAGATIPPVDRTRYQELFVTRPGQQPYRIPAIAQAKNGNLIAVSDHRPCGSDIGYGEVDIKVRISKDNGKTWGEERFIANGTGVKGAPDCGFGDAAIVADRQSNEVLILCVHGETPYWNGNYPEGNPNPVGLLRSLDGGETWQAYEGISEQIYSPFRQSKHGMIKSLFFGSGRLCQSSRIKVGSHYRIYGAVAARDGGNRVFYSDDFGRSWNVLGGVDALPCVEGDEPKIEELPNGNVLLSSRVFPQKWHRLYNIYTYDNVKTGTGTWAQAAHTGNLPAGVLADRNNTDGEILIVPALRKADRKRVHLALQSVPFGPGRANVGIYFKALTRADYSSPQSFGSHWEGRHQVSTLPSAYSTMIVQADRRIGFYYEEQTHGKGADYTEVYVPLTLEEITGGRYAIDPKYKPLGRQKLER
ncbi:MAG: sialidase family protein [Bacteroidales bacterium]|nr:sialidase family protein [Bacteroidales bacterium]